MTAPIMLPESYVRQFLEEKQIWIREQHQRLLIQRNIRRKKMVAGSEVLLLGRPLTVVFRYQNAKRIKVHKHGEHLIFDFDTRRLDLEPETTQIHLIRALRLFYKTCAQEVLPERVAKFSKALGLKPRRLSFRDQKTRWGSCSSTGALSFNWKLIAAPLEVVDYVVVHELCHLQHLNHSAKFWNLVETQVSEMKARKKWLRDHAHKLEFLSE